MVLYWLSRVSGHWEGTQRPSSSLVHRGSSWVTCLDLQRTTGWLDSLPLSQPRGCLSPFLLCRCALSLTALPATFCIYPKMLGCPENVPWVRCGSQTHFSFIFQMYLLKYDLHDNCIHLICTLQWCWHVPWLPSMMMIYLYFTLAFGGRISLYSPAGLAT